MDKQSKDSRTSSVAPTIHFFNSASPDFIYTPFENAQHSHLRSRLQHPQPKKKKTNSLHKVLIIQEAFVTTLTNFKKTKKQVYAVIVTMLTDFEITRNPQNYHWSFEEEGSDGEDSDGKR